MRRLSPRSVSIGLAAIALLSILLGISRIPLLEPDEGRNARVAQEIVASRDWVLPHFHGMPYLDKPILYFAAVASSLAVFGSTEAAARLPSLLFAIATGLATWALARRLFSARAAWASVMRAREFSALPGFRPHGDLRHRAHLLRHPRALVRGGGAGGRRWGFPPFWVCTALAVLTKGPVGIAPTPPWFRRDRPSVSEGRGDLRGLFHPVGIAVFLVVCMPWVLAVESRQPGFLRYALLVETVERLDEADVSADGAVLLLPADPADGVAAVEHRRGR